MSALIKLSRKQAAKHPGLRWQKLNEILAFAELENLTPVQRIAALAYNYNTQILMAGLHGFFFDNQQLDYTEVGAAFRAVGANEQASVLEAALAAVRTAATRAPEIYANRFIAGLEYAELDQFAESFANCKRSVPDCLLDYVEKHQTEFIEWTP